MKEQQRVSREDRERATTGAGTPGPVPASPATGAGPEIVPAQEGGLGSAGEVVGVLGSLREQLVGADLSRLDDAGRLELLRVVEDLTRTLGALAAGVQVAFEISQVQTQAAAGVPRSRRAKAVADELARAAKTSPYWASRHLTSARALVTEMPCTWAALADATISPVQARLVTEATSCLSVRDRAEVDRRLAPSLVGASTKQVVATARALTYEVDPAGFVARSRKAAADRGLSIRPAPDVMALLSARLPAAQAITCYQGLKQHAAAQQANGDPRTIAQLMADELYARLTGAQVVDGIDIEVGLVITDAALFGGDSAAADLQGYGPIPADLARDLLRPTSDNDNHDNDDHNGDEHDNDDHSDHGDDDHDNDDEHEVHADGNGDGEARHPAQHHPGPDQGNSPDQDGDHRAEQAQLCPSGGRCTSASCTLLHTGYLPPARPAKATNPAHPGGNDDTSRDKDPSNGDKDPSNGDKDPSSRGGGDQGRAGPCGLVRAARVWLRRLYTDPVTGALTVRDPRRRLFTGNLRATLITRGRYCANAWCGAPIRHVDHIRRWADGGQTTQDNGRGLCARCNLARERPRHADPPPQAYLDPPPILDTFLARPPQNAPPPPQRKAA